MDKGIRKKREREREREKKTSARFLNQKISPLPLRASTNNEHVLPKRKKRRREKESADNWERKELEERWRRHSALDSVYSVVCCAVVQSVSHSSNRGECARLRGSVSRRSRGEARIIGRREEIAVDSNRIEEDSRRTRGGGGGGGSNVREGVDRAWVVGRASTRTTPDPRLPVRDAAHVGTRVSDKFADTASPSGRSHRGFPRILEQRYVPPTNAHNIILLPFNCFQFYLRFVFAEMGSLLENFDR